MTASQSRATPDGFACMRVTFAGADIELDGSGAAYMFASETLIVSDLHLEKGSAARGRLIPPHDSRDTLQRLARVVERIRPARVVCLGDSFQDGAAGERMSRDDMRALTDLCRSVSNWVWVSGNHDPETPAFCPGERADMLDIGGIVLSHQPKPGAAYPQIAGHFHPKAALWTGRYRFSGPCFSVCERLLLMPAFGAYTGGLRCTDPAIASLHGAARRVFMLHAGKVWRVG